MGLSSSQARLLTLTARIHQLEYKAAKLESQKLQMANESRQVYEEYLNALESTKVQVKTLNNDGSASYKDITSYQDFIDAGYALEYNGTIYNNGVIKITPTSYNMQLRAGDIVRMDWDSDGTPEHRGTIDTDMLLSDYIPPHYYGYVSYIERNSGSSFETLCQDVYGGDAPNQGNDIMNLITNLINSGEVRIVKLDGNNTETSVAIDTGLQEVSDETLLRKAEAKYEADMRKIDAKDRKYDTDLAALDAERNAIKSEMETLKTVAKDNVERTFKLFS